MALRAFLAAAKFIHGGAGFDVGVGGTFHRNGIFCRQNTAQLMTASVV
jgi:hypothetical protein